MFWNGKGVLWEPRLSNRVREGNSGRFQRKNEKGKRTASVLSSLSLSCFSVIHVFMSSVHELGYLVRLFTALRGADFWSCASSAKSWWFTEWLATISERGVVYRTKRTGPSTESSGISCMRCDWWRRRVIDWSGGREFGGNWCQNLQKDPTKGEQKCCHCPERREYRLQYWHN